MTRLGQCARGRDNNFNLIRIIAAGAVLISHAWPITGGSGTVEPLESWTGYRLGTLAVIVFFSISGFLIAASAERARATSAFVTARMRRIFPAFAFSILLSGLLLGPMVTILPPATYLFSAELWRFLLGNLSLIEMHYHLPGVFNDLPYPMVAGSIWTLPHEVACYLALAGLRGMGLIGPQRRLPPKLLLGLCLGLWLCGALLPLPARLGRLHLLALPFMMGVVAWHLRDRLPLRPAPALILLLLAAEAGKTALGWPMLCLALCYGSLCAAYLPGGWLRIYNRLGDYSYGLYLYAFPLQGLCVFLFGPMGPALNITLALPASCLCAVLSWHLIEAPFLRARAQPDCKAPTWAEPSSGTARPN
ncbi:acyltransferase, partial [Thioclava sp. BHET1]